MSGTNEGYDDMFSLWKEFNFAVQDQMAEAIEAGQEGYKNLNESWSDMAKGMADLASMLDPTIPETMEVYNVWRNYSTKMARRMEIVMSERQDRFNRLIETWGDWASEVGKRPEGESDEATAEMFERTYLDWLIFSGRFLAEIMRSRDGTGANVTELVKTWRSFSKTMTDALNRLVKNGGEHYRDVSKAWLEFIDTVGDRLEEFTNGTEADFNQMYDMWLSESRTLGRRMAHVAASGAHGHPKHVEKPAEAAEVANGSGGSK